MKREMVSSMLAAALMAQFGISWCGDNSEWLQYRRIRLDNATCDVGVAYRPAPYGIDIAVSAIALGKFQDLRWWRVEKVKLRIGEARIRPDKCEKFFVRKDSFWKYPAAVLWAVIGSQYSGLDNYGTFAEGIGKIGMAIGLGILTLQAKGDIPGQVCKFYLKGDTARRIAYGIDSVRIEIKNQDTNKTEDLIIMLERPSWTGRGDDYYNKMSKDELSGELGRIDNRISALEMDLANCRSGNNPLCGGIQKDLDSIRSEQAVAYKAWIEK